MRRRSIDSFAVHVKLSIQGDFYTLHRLADGAQSIVRGGNPDLTFLPGEEPFLNRLIPEERLPLVRRIHRLRSRDAFGSRLVLNQIEDILRDIVNGATVFEGRCNDVLE